MAQKKANGPLRPLLRIKVAVVLTVCVAWAAACGGGRPQSTTSQPDATTAPPKSCPAPNLLATQSVRHLNLTPENGPSAELGSQADVIWTFPDPNSQSGRIMGVELFRGRMNPLMNSPFEGEAATIRGFPSTLGSIEGGLGLLWQESTAACDTYALTSYGLSKEELVQFANGLKRNDQESY